MWTFDKEAEFIQLVEGKPCMWNIHCKAYKDSQLKEICREEIADVLQVPVTEIMPTLNRLRFQYYKELENQQDNGSEHRSHSKWKHFNSLSFLKHTNLQRPSRPSKPNINVDGRSDWKSMSLSTQNSAESSSASTLKNEVTTTTNNLHAKDVKRYTNITRQVRFKKNKCSGEKDLNSYIVKPINWKAYRMPKMKPYNLANLYSHWIAEISTSNIDKFMVEVKEFKKNLYYILNELANAVVRCIIAQENVAVFISSYSEKSDLAELVFQKTFQTKERVFFVSPSDLQSKRCFLHFTRRFEDVGLLTADVCKFGQSRIMIMTVDCLHEKLLREERNIFFDEVSWIIFDNAHFLSDPDNGFMLEECLIIIPKYINVVLLSSSFSNAQEISKYVAYVRQKTCHVIATSEYPQANLIYYTIDEANKIFRIKGKEEFVAWKRTLNSNLKKTAISKQKIEKKWHNLLENFKITHQLPVVVFSFRKETCEELLTLQLEERSLNSPDEEQQVKKYYDMYLEKVNLLEEKLLVHVNMHLGFLKKGYAVYHMGMVSQIRELIAILFENNLVKMVFSTVKFANDVWSSAKTLVVFDLETCDIFEKKFLTPFGFNLIAEKLEKNEPYKEKSIIVMLNKECDLETLEGLIYHNKMDSSYHLSVSTMLHYPLAKEAFSYKDIYHLSLLFFQGDEDKKESLKHNAHKLEEILRKTASANKFRYFAKYCNVFPLIESYIFHKMRMKPCTTISYKNVISDAFKIITSKTIAERLLTDFQSDDDIDGFIQTAADNKLMLKLELGDHQQYLADFAPFGYSQHLIDAALQWFNGKTFSEIYFTASHGNQNGKIIYEGEIIRAFKNCILILKKMVSFCKSHIEENHDLPRLLSRVVNKMDRGIVAASSIYIECVPVEEHKEIDIGPM